VNQCGVNGEAVYYGYRDVVVSGRLLEHDHKVFFQPVSTLKVLRRTTYAARVVWKVDLVSPPHTFMITLIFFVLAKRKTFCNDATTIPKYNYIKKFSGRDVI
jgi:hypothetical protein